MTVSGGRRALSVAVVQGGPSTEAEVSRASASGVASGLEQAGHRVARLELDPSLAEVLRAGGFDVVFPAVHGAGGEDGRLQGLLETLGLPFVGSGVLASALAMNKVAARTFFAHAGLPIAEGRSFPRGVSALDAARAVLRDLGPAVVVKPASNGSAIGVTRIEASGEETRRQESQGVDGDRVRAVRRAIDDVWEMDDLVLVERLMPGREVTCAVLDLDTTEALAPTEITAESDPFYNFEARYTPGRSKHVCPANLSRSTAERVQEIATSAHRALGCRDLSRVDFVVVDAGPLTQVTLLEVNTLPGMTPTSLFPEAAAQRGLSMALLCDALVTHAFERGSQELARKVRARPLPANAPKRT